MRNVKAGNGDTCSQGHNMAVVISDNNYVLWDSLLHD